MGPTIDTENPMPTIETGGLTKRFGSFTAVDHVSFSVREGEVFGLLGPNGAGKTTTVRMLACLLAPTEGTATVRGLNIGKDSLKVREMVGILTENPSLYERLTAHENMDFFAEAYGITDRTKRSHRVKELLEFFELWDRRDDRVAKFSNGMKQKLAIARAIVHNPPIVYLDEPTSGLDPESAKIIRDLIQGLSRHGNHSILLCTHRLEDAEKLCHRVMIINKGKSIVTGTIEELTSRVQTHPIVQVALAKLDQGIVDSVKESDYVREVAADTAQGTLTITVDDYESSTPTIVKRIVAADGRILSVNRLRPSLEEAYLRLVKGGPVEN